MRSVAAIVLLFLCARGGLAQITEAPDKGSPVPDGLKALKHPDPTIRLKAVTVLCKLGKVGRFAVPQLREALSDKDGRVRVKAVEALWQIEPPSPETVLPVLRAGLRDRDPAVRASVPAVIALIGKPARPAFPALVLALRDKDINVRMEVILALGELGPLASN